MCVLSSSYNFTHYLISLTPTLLFYSINLFFPAIFLHFFLSFNLTPPPSPPPFPSSMYFIPSLSLSIFLSFTLFFILPHPSLLSPPSIFIQLVLLLLLLLLLPLLLTLPPRCEYCLTFSIVQSWLITSAGAAKVLLRLLLLTYFRK